MRNYKIFKGEDLDTMSTRRVWKQSEIKTNPLFSKMRSTIETAFYGNNVTPVTSVAQAYQLAAEEPGVMVKLQVAMQKLVVLLAMKVLMK